MTDGGSAGFEVAGSLVFAASVLLLGASFISLGLFASSLTENQTVAAVLSFGALLFFWVIGWASDLIQIEQVGSFIDKISLLTHYQSFVAGTLNTTDIVYYILFIAFFLYATYRVVEKRSWR